MEKRLLGKSGLVVSELGLGTMTFGRETDQATAERIIHRYLDAGGNFIDTADVYVNGQAEEIVGQAIKGRRSEVVLATKVGMRVAEHPNGVGYSRKRIMEGVEESLRRLQTDYIDLYLVHVWDQTTPVEEMLSTLDYLIQSGKVRYIGCCNFLAWQIMKSLAYSDFTNKSRFITTQAQYSLVSRELDREIVSLCLEEEVGIIPWAPLAGGFLTGKYTKIAEPDFGRFSQGGKGEYNWERKFTNKNFEILSVVKEIASKNNKTPAQVSLNWLLEKKGITSPIFGVTTEAHLEENLGSVGWRLSSEDWQRLDEVSRLPLEYPNRFIDKFQVKLT